MTMKTLLCSTAIVALLATPALAQSTADPNLAVDPLAAPTAGATDAAPLTAEGGDVPPPVQAPVEEGPLTVAQVVGMNVLGAEDTSVGEIDYVVMDGGKLSAVIGIGGFLGFGEYTVMLPIEEFDMIDRGNLRLASRTREQLKAMPEVDERSLEMLPSDMVVGDRL